MEVEGMPTPGCSKFPRIRNGNGRAGKKRDEQYLLEEGEAAGGEEAAVAQSRNVTSTGVAGGVGGGGGGGVGGGLDISGGGLGRFCGGWPSSRIVRVSRASGGKDRHSKVWTSKGLRDRRVRLSVNTAIQFYDLQDRLGFDQPSKAVEWLLKAASSSISELPSINTSFPDTQQQLSDEKRSSTTVGNTDQHGFDSAEAEMESDQLYLHQHEHGVATGTAGGGGSNFSKSACSSTSETSKGSGLSLSRSESRIKARERARERAAEKEKEKEHQNPVNPPPPISQSSFTELLTGGANNNTNASSSSPNRGNNGGPNESNFFQKSSPRHWSPSTPMDYFGTGLLGGLSSNRATNPSPTASFLGQIQLGNHQLHHQSVTAVSSSPLLFSVSGGGEHQSELHHFSFVPDHHLIPVVTVANNASSNGNGGSDYNLNFTMTPSSATPGYAAAGGFNRGTLQSNSSSSPSSLLQPAPHLVQRFQNMDRSTAFFTTTSTATQPNAAAVEDHQLHHNHHHHHQHHTFLPGYEAGRLQLCYGDGGSGGGGHHSDQKPKVKN